MVRLHILSGYGSRPPQDPRHLFGPAAGFFRTDRWARLVDEEAAWEAEWWGYDPPAFDSRGPDARCPTACVISRTRDSRSCATRVVTCWSRTGSWARGGLATTSTTTSWGSSTMCTAARYSSIPAAMSTPPIRMVGTCFEARVPITRSAWTRKSRTSAVRTGCSGCSRRPLPNTSRLSRATSGSRIAAVTAATRVCRNRSSTNGRSR